MDDGCEHEDFASFAGPVRVTMKEIPFAIIGAATVAVLSFLGTRLFTWWQHHTKFGHLRDFTEGSKRVKIILSSVPVISDADEFIRAQPANVLFSPTAEGAAVARLLLKFHDIRKDLQVELQPAKEFAETANDAPFVCVGGPSVNEISDHLIKRYLPNFEINYPGHEVKIGGSPYSAPQQSNGFLLEDYGFLLTGRTPTGTRFAVVWGVYAFGTMVAARALVELGDKKRYRKSERSGFSKDEGLFLVAHGKVEGYQLTGVVEPVRPQPDPWRH
jgi:hypothetical protein